ncbi:hypothetical protein CDV36_000231 [Fusarium kuroshium]|uniref:Extracellular membrane protein CFEM domain-containing protein n=1 Tax=Fusarium kuroshium TaxID=2010991 RepID=A0A3M2SRG3_9HYPO|nr:hypothetical protein CDV36_000231 [Fusarium kuroshium]
MHFQTLFAAILALTATTLTLASPCRKKGPFIHPSDCGKDAKWNARKRQCDCINPDTKWSKDSKRCSCRTPGKVLNRKGECVCGTDQLSLWMQTFDRNNENGCAGPHLVFNPKGLRLDYRYVEGPKSKKKEETESPPTTARPVIAS